MAARVSASQLVALNLAPVVPGPWTVVVPNWHPCPLNKLMRMHWLKRTRSLEAEAALVAYHCALAGVAPAIGPRRVTQVRTLMGRDKRVDGDNAWKGLLDALVKCKALVDDGPDWVVVEPIQQERGKERGTTILLEDLV